MDLQVIEKSNFVPFVQNLINAHQVEGVKRKGEGFFYGTIQEPEELCLDFDCTLLPPKKYFLPPNETLFRFQTSPSLEVTPMMVSNPFVLFGVHPYDLKAINQMDQVFARGVSDPHYLNRRKACVLIGIDPTRVAPRAFWADMEAAAVSQGFDLMLTDIGEGFVAEAGSDRGRELLSKHAKARAATKEEVQERVNRRSSIFDRCRKGRGLSFPSREIPTLLEQSGEKLLWEEKAAKCLNCGTCNLVCPTCYCFDVQDELALDLAHGERIRRWDGCLLQDFARVATGENFRESRTSRYRHRLYRKGQYLFGVLGDVACVGCGRCASSCLPDIADPVDVFNRLKQESVELI